ncbi:MAG: DUF1801 domain-containing protein, partial [Verrucomicrobiota bacterium]
MVQSKATTVEGYLKELAPERREVVAAVRDCILKHLPKGYEEAVNWGMISYEVPLERYPETYNKKPLMYCSLAAQKNHYAVYLMCAYVGSKQMEILEKGYEKAGIKLDMGKCCVRFKKLEGVHLPTIGKVVKSCSVAQF